MPKYYDIFQCYHPLHERWIFLCQLENVGVEMSCAPLFLHCVLHEKNLSMWIIEVSGVKETFTGWSHESVWQSVW